MNELIAAQDGCTSSDSDCVNVAEAMIYNEWAQLLEATDPTTGDLFQPDQFFVFNYNDLGTAMLQDGLWARAVVAGRGEQHRGRPALPRGLVQGLDVLPRSSR